MKQKAKKPETVKIQICPKCRSGDVRHIFTLKNLFGVIPKMQCKKCSYESRFFPIAVVDMNNLNKNKPKTRKNKK